jgi:hypothetical protein
MIIKEKGRSNVPIFIKIQNGNQLEIAPLPRDSAKVYELEITLTDSLGATSGPSYMKV